MRRSRLASVALLTLGLALVGACSTKSDKGSAGTTDGANGGATAYPLNSATKLVAPNGEEVDLREGVGARVWFGYDSYSLNDDARRTLDAQAYWLEQNRNVAITIEGHADERGTREYNLALGERRAQSVKNYLSAAGVSADRINTISYGKERPLVEGTGESVWRYNRRAHTGVN